MEQQIERPITMLLQVLTRHVDPAMLQADAIGGNADMPPGLLIRRP
jgi:hypothetical protein